VTAPVDGAAKMDVRSTVTGAEAVVKGHAAVPVETHAEMAAMDVVALAPTLLVNSNH